MAYKAVQVQDGINIYYSKVFAPYKEQVDKLKSKPALLEQFTTQYEVWICYHAILQYNERQSMRDIDEDVYEQMMEADRIRVANLEVKQALNVAELTLRATQAEADKAA